MQVLTNVEEEDLDTEACIILCMSPWEDIWEVDVEDPVLPENVC
jgi:hypothetical protein